jgi:signal transduction histidine kinase
MLTTEIHTKVVNQSYDELLETNRRLTLSEKRYRELAESLEVRVRERTEELKRAYARMLQQEKLASVGQLAAGVAHEINNPLGFILSNLQTLRKYVGKFAGMLEFYRSAADTGQMTAGLVQTAEGKWRELKLDFVLSDLEELFSHSITGAERVKKIVADLRGFSHVDDTGSGSIRINDELERTLSVIAAEIPSDAQIIRNFSELPEVKGNAGMLCQAFLNIIRNALQCRPAGLKLLIRTEVAGAKVRLSFVDNGPGMPEEVRKRVFEPFFTTRQVGDGVGMGLTVAYDGVKQAGGTIAVKSQEGRGTALIIELPGVGSDK